MSDRFATERRTLATDDRIELGRSHIAALGLGTFFFGVLAFLVGLQTGRSGTAEAEVAQVPVGVFVPNIGQIDELDTLLREVELARSALPPQIAEPEVPLNFPTALTQAPQASLLHSTDSSLTESGAPPIAETGPVRPASLPMAIGRGWSVQLATYATLDDAEAHVAALKDEHPGAYSVAALVDGRSWFRVRIGGFEDQSQAEAALAQLAEQQVAADLRVALAP